MDGCNVGGLGVGISRQVVFGSPFHLTTAKLQRLEDDGHHVIFVPSSVFAGDDGAG